ncbi:MAG: cbb3-type cytochrome c oxidase subunit I [Myxococcales bacterium]|nr:cbb3-type cytochrome c oxidase subunit I [Myxococcales bacterium]
MSGPAPTSFWRRYVFSTDHKVIAKQYLFTGVAMAFVGGLLAYVFRSQLAWPGEPVPGWGPVGLDEYNALVTLHGMIMVFWVAMPVLVAGFGNLLIPLMVGTDDMAFPRLNMLSFWIFFLSTLLVVASFFAPGGPPGTGWTLYPPLSTSGMPGAWGVDVLVLAVALEFAAFLMGGINFLTTAINKRARGMGMWDLPLFVWEEIIASIVFMLSVGPLIAGALMLLADRHFGTGFYDPRAGGDPLLFQHLFWFFGHPEVYVLLLPALGIVAEIFCAGARKTLFGYRTIVWATIVAGLLSFIVWAHHQFVAGIDPRLAAPFSLTTILISVPFSITIFALIATLWGGSIRFSLPLAWAVAMVAEFLLGGVTGIVNGSAAADIYVHDSYFVVAHFHYTLVPIALFAPLAGFYFWFPKMTGRMLDARLGLLHLVATVVFFNVTFLPQFALGMMGMHRRIANPAAFEFLREGMPLQELSTVGVIGLLVSQAPFVVNLVWSWLRGPVAGANPWRATTLDWQCPSPPPHGNFEREVVVRRGPYVYSPPGSAEDFVPQDAPDAERAGGGAVPSPLVQPAE